MRRGTTYRFLVNGGDDSTSGSQYHPSISPTVSAEVMLLSPEERLEVVFAGINVLNANENGVFEFEPTAVRPICSYKATGRLSKPLTIRASTRAPSQRFEVDRGREFAVSHSTTRQVSEEKRSTCLNMIYYLI